MSSKSNCNIMERKPAGVNLSKSWNDFLICSSIAKGLPGISVYYEEPAERV